MCLCAPRNKFESCLPDSLERGNIRFPARDVDLRKFWIPALRQPLLSSTNARNPVRGGRRALHHTYTQRTEGRRVKCMAQWLRHVTDAPVDPPLRTP